MNTVRFTTHTAEATQALAESLGWMLTPGDVLCLVGELGAGKTTFTQGLARGLELPPAEVVNSPTFTLVAEHHGGRVPLVHFDVYRLRGPAELADLAFDEYLAGDSVLAIEWADIVREALPEDRLTITFSVDEATDQRDIGVTATGPRSMALLNSWKPKPSLESAP